MASIVLGSIGSSLLGPIGGFIGSALGSYVDSYLFAPAPPDVTGPRLTDLSAMRADPGAPIPLVFGADRVAGIVIATTDLIETITHKKVGGKGGRSYTMTNYTYKVDNDLLLCEGPILGVCRIWADGKLLRGTRYDIASDTTGNPENIGGIPYPARYRAAYYDPKKVPWSLNPSYTATASVERYTLDANMTTFSIIAAADIQTAIEAGTIVYWLDSATGYYIPLNTCHAYAPDSKKAVYVPDGTKQGFSYDMMSDSGNLAVTNFGWNQYNLVLGTKVGEWFLSATATWADTTEEPISGGFKLYDIMYLCRDFDLLKLGIPVEAIDSGTLTVDATVGSYQWALGGNQNSLSIDTMLDANGDGTPDLDSTASTDVEEVFWSLLQGGSTTTKLVGAKIPPKTRFVRVRIFLWDGVQIYPKALRFNYDGYVPYAGPERNWDSYYNLFDAINDWSTAAVLAYTGTNNVTLYRGTNDQIADPAMATAIGHPVPAYIGRAHVAFDGFELADFGNRLPNLTFECVHYDNDRVSSVVASLIDRSGIGSQYYDVASLTNTTPASFVMGYSVASRTTFRAAIEQLVGAYGIDAAEIGDRILFRDARRISDHTVNYDDLGADTAGNYRDGAPITMNYRDPLEMPMRLSMKFKDAERDYQANLATYRRQIVTAVQDSSSEIAAVVPQNLAKLAVRNKMQDLWLERVSATTKLPHKYIYISPTDIIDIVQNGMLQHRVKVTSITRGANGILDINAVRREVSHYTLAAGETDNTNMSNYYGLVQTSSSGSEFTRLELMDTPPLRDQDGVLGYYVAMGGTSNAWPGATLYESVNGLVSYDEVYSTLGAATMGRVISTPLLYRPAGIVDMDSSFEVTLGNVSDSLSSVTVAELFTGSNFALVGNEVINFKNATLVSGSTYRIDGGILRGRRGTDDDDTLMGHEVTERFVLLDPATIRPVIDTITNINKRFPFKAVSTGRSIANIQPAYFTDTGQRVRPFSVVGVSGTRDGVDNLTVAWVRRNRIYYDWIDHTDIPNSEQTEDYEIDITEHTGSLVYRTVRVSNATSFIYTAAEQTIDGLTPGDPVYVSIYQMSTIVGRGRIRREEL